MPASLFGIKGYTEQQNGFPMLREEYEFRLRKKTPISTIITHNSHSLPSSSYTGVSLVVTTHQHISNLFVFEQFKENNKRLA